MYPSAGEQVSGSAARIMTSVLVPTRFYWPHGGRRVSLVGSFTRWVDPIPMSPTEGCPTVFQAIYNLPPGYHQYKFIVDGECRHDEQQPTVTPTFGIVNNIILVTIPELLASPVNQEPFHHGVNMEVDHSVAERVIRHPEAKDMLRQLLLPKQVLLSDDTLKDHCQRVSADNIEVLRRRIADFLSAQTAYDLLPVSGKIVALDISLPVKQAFHVLHEQGIPVAPLWDSKSGFVGMLSASDFIIILKELGRYGALLSEEELDTHTIAAWKDQKILINRQADQSLHPHRRNLASVSPFDSMKDVAQKILHNEVATVPVIHSSQDGSSPQLLHLASLSDILKCICRHFRLASGSLPLLQTPICLLPLGTWIPELGKSGGRPLAMLHPNATLSSALSLLLDAKVSSIPIVDENGSLLDVYSRSDITALAKDRVYTHLQLDEMSVHQALQIGQDRNASGSADLRCHMCLRSDPFQKVVESLSNPGVRRLICVEAGTNRVEGIISLSDVFKFLLG
eukprot:TRINITY_DN16528_c0_g1_i1.p1 TRINITY_DN16528_c0_g1~~TRINITY_DN16528_c0_g1_i1.p1  ORF type:complete len:509 (-),score=101.56 TRINITY_DN16528_c0_g1_i1:535-2061(-)